MLNRGSDWTGLGCVPYLKPITLNTYKAVVFSNSKEFQKWSKYFADAFPDNPDEAARLMVSTLAKYRKGLLVDSIPTIKAMKDVKLMGYAESLEESLLALSDRLMAVKDSKAIGERIQNEMLDGLFSNNDDLVDVIEIQNLQTWYFRKPQGPVSTRTRDLYHKIEQLGISEEKIGEAHSKADGDAGRITKELVDYKLEQQLKTVNVKDAAHACVRHF
ncbi:hypothetical protein Plhal710r2_c040g0139761 [Plasmopara halstedii]